MTSLLSATSQSLLSLVFRFLNYISHVLYSHYVFSFDALEYSSFRRNDWLAYMHSDEISCCMTISIIIILRGGGPGCAP